MVVRRWMAAGGANGRGHGRRWLGGIVATALAVSAAVVVPPASAALADPAAAGPVAALAGSGGVGAAPAVIQRNGSTSVFSVNPTNGHLELREKSQQPGGSWVTQDLSARYGIAAAAGHPAVLNHDGVVRVFTVTAGGGHLQETSLRAGGSGWVTFDMTAANHVPVVTGGPAVLVHDGVISVFAVTKGSGKLHEAFYRPGYPWVGQDLSAQTGTPPAAAGPTALFHDGVVSIFTVSAQGGRLRETFLMPYHNWAGQDLSARTGTPPAAGSPAAVRQPSGVMSVFTVNATGGNLHEAYLFPHHDWTGQDVSVQAGTPVAVGTPAVVANDAAMSVITTNAADGQLHETYLAGRWSTRALPQNGWPPTPSGSPAVTVLPGYTGVFAVDAAGTVRETYRSGADGAWKTRSTAGEPADPPVTRPGDPSTFDRVHAARVREDTCRLGHTLHVGDPALKAVSQAGLLGSADELHAAAMPGPLEAAYNRDEAASVAEWAAADRRRAAWENLLWEPQIHLPTQPNYGFYTPPESVRSMPFSRAASWYVHSRRDLISDLAPRASGVSRDAAAQLAKVLYTPQTRNNEQDRTAWEREVHPRQHSDDFRIFLQYGGFPTVAPAPGTAEFRMDVEALKMRFASCETAEPVDPHRVLGQAVTVAGMEWQAELDAQAGPRADIVAAHIRADADLAAAAEAMHEAVGLSWTAGQLVKWQTYWLSDIGRNQTAYAYPVPTKFAAVSAGILTTQDRAKAQLVVAKRAAASAGAQGLRVAAAQEQAGRIAVVNGTPPGRGLAYAHQSAQVTKAMAAATLAVSKATETAVNATLATAATSAAVVASAQAQANATQAEFLRTAAKEAADQANQAAVGAKKEAEQAADAAVRATVERVKAEKAEAAARESAQRTKTHRETAEREQKTAAAERAHAAAEGLKASQAEAQAQADRSTAAARRTEADNAAATAALKRADAEGAETGAHLARNVAVRAQERKDAAIARAEAAEAHADASEGEANAGEARTAATKARAEANAATTAATSARSAADEATTAAINARAAATRATAAAERSRAAADNAKATAAQTHAHAQVAHAAAADAVAAARQAADNVLVAQVLADKAEAEASKAHKDAVGARRHADTAKADAATTAGHAYASAQYAVAAADCAAAVLTPADEAITLGSPYRQTDASAALAVLTGQAAKTIAQQQDAVAQARATQAAQAAKDAHAAATRADADAKAAAESAAYAATQAAAAAQSVKDARVSAAAASVDAAAAVKADNNAAEHDRQAQADATAADKAASTAETDARAARDSATEAERDAASARTAADQAEAEAAAARTSADNAERDATAAEAAAQRARDSAQAAENAATNAEQQAYGQALAEVISGNGASKTAGVIVVPEDINDHVTEPLGQCMLERQFNSLYCDMFLDHHITGRVAYLSVVCRDPSATHCPDNYTFTHLLSESVDHKFTQHHKKVPIWKDNPLIAIGLALVTDFIDCASRTKPKDQWQKACLWIGIEFATAELGVIARAVAALRASIRTGAGISEALAAVRATKIDPATLALLELDASKAIITKCVIGNSFDGRTKVAMARGNYKPISQVRIGDRVRATDPGTGRTIISTVTQTFHHYDTDAVDVAVRGAGGRTAVIRTTADHPFWDGSRHTWTSAADLSIGTRLHTGSGKRATVAGTRTVDGARLMYDLTVRHVHTYYVIAGDTPVLVHNTNCGPGSWSRIEYKGQRVYQRDDLVNPNYTSPADKYGRTNRKRMQQGLAPMGPDDNPMNLHHMLQTQDGPIAELTQSMHQGWNRELHINTGSGYPSGIDRAAFDLWRAQYWKDRAAGLTGR